MQYYVYILFSQRNGTLYIGVTSDIIKRIYEHKTALHRGFTKRHSVDKLGYYEIYENVEYAIQREKKLKSWDRDWKLALIEKDNPDWRDLYLDLIA